MKYLKCFCEGLTPDLVKRARDKLGETEEIRNRTMEELKQLLDAEPDFSPRTDDILLLCFLRSRKFKVDEAFKRISNYYKYVAQHSGVFTDFTPAELKPVIEQNYITVLEYREQNSTGIILVRPAMFDMEKYTFEQYISILPLLLEVLVEVEATQVAGFSVIFDCTNFGLNTVKFFSRPLILYSLATGLKDCLPGRVTALHGINMSVYAHTLSNLCKLFLSRKLQKRIHLHGTNLESLHKHIPTEILPEELGGKQGPIAKSANLLSDVMFSKENHFQELKRYGYTGKTRQKLCKN